MLQQLAQATLQAFQEVAAQHPDLEVTLVELDGPSKAIPHEASVTIHYGGNLIVQAQMFLHQEVQVEV